jgi:hypothetical protein
MTFESVLTIIILVNAMATITLWQRAARRPEKLKKSFRNRLWKGKPITPKHEPPPPLKKGLFVREAELQFFSDFEDFAEVVNSWLASPYAYAHSNSWWRVQELPRSELLYLGGPDPTYGRTYAVFHNQVRIGEMEIKPGSRRPEGVHGMMSSRRRSILGRRRERFSFPTRGGLLPTILTLGILRFCI